MSHGEGKWCYVLEGDTNVSPGNIGFRQTLKEGFKEQHVLIGVS